MSHRILHILPDMSLGPEQVVVLRMAEHDRAGTLGHVAAVLSPHGDLERLFRQAGCRVASLGHTGFFERKTVADRLDALIRHAGVDLIHCGDGVWERFYGYAAALRGNLPVVQTIRHPSKSGRPRTLLGRASEGFVRVVLTRGMAREVVRHAVVVASNPATLDVQGRSALRSLGLEDSAVSVVPPEGIGLEKVFRAILVDRPSRRRPPSFGARDDGDVG